MKVSQHKIHSSKLVKPLEQNVRNTLFTQLINSTKYFLPNELLLRLYHFAGLTKKDVETTRNQVGNNTNELLLLLTAR